MKTKLYVTIIISILVVAGIAVGIIFGIIGIEGPKGAKIVIYSDEDLAKYPGEGTTENPYIIENLEFRTPKTIGIDIQGVTKCFEIRNCNISADWGGMTMHNVSSSYCKIVNSSFYGFEWGIDIYGVNSIIFENNHIHGGELGLDMSSVNTTLIEENNIYASFGSSARLSSIKQGLVISNTFEDQELSVRYCSLNITNNDFRYCGFGINNLKWEYNNFEAYINFSCNSFVNTHLTYYTGSAGIFYDDYMNLDDLKESIFANNSIDDKALIFLTHTSHFTLSNMEVNQLNLIKCINITLENITMVNSHDDAKETDMTEIKLLQCSEIDVLDCNFSLFSRMKIEDCWNISINSTSFTEAVFGIRSKRSSNITITFCFFANFSGSGICLEQVTDSFIHHNSFMEACAVYDIDGSDNMWYDTSSNEGNYYKYYDGNPSGYFISGSTGSVDSYPLDLPPV